MTAGRRTTDGCPSHRARSRHDHLLRLLETGDLTVVHDLTVALDDIVEVYRRVDGGHEVGNIVVRP